MTEQPAVIEIQMLGGFSLRYNGERVTVGRNSAPRFMQLLQLIWVKGEEGISRDKLMDSLYEDNGLANQNNSFNNLIYQMRKQMRAAGLPDADYIVKKGGLFVQDPNAPVRVDVQEFRELLKQGDAEIEADRRYPYYRKAALLYAGTLLPGLTKSLWVISESIELKNLYTRCVRWLCEYCRRRDNFSELRSIAASAAVIYPDDDWQAVHMEALTGLGRYRDAYKVYTQASNHYTDDLQLPPSEKLTEAYRVLSEKMNHEAGNVQTLREEIRRDGEKYRLQLNDINGAYYCPYLSFLDVYRILCWNMERMGRPVMLMVCTLTDREGNVLQNEEKIKRVSDSMRKALHKSLRRGDAFTSYSNLQSLVLLAGAHQEDCHTIAMRIRRELREIAGQNTYFRYTASAAEELMKKIEIEHEIGKRAGSDEMDNVDGGITA